ncbi:NDR1/HIN1-like protein 10 [Senna tora]|uniref:NDR1/HIN1-like protein 10 n=1 Tax=Senna tora TaxID=362788 RepID=A0A834TA76_9FABA|nr:NDR1/HIN1-like protein 10 [Senna tora]
MMARQTPYPAYIQCLIFVLLLLVAFLIVSGVVLTVMFFPHPPKFQIVSFQVSPIILTPLDHSFLVSATWNLTFVARNPNKRLQLSYNYVDVSVYYKWICLSSRRVDFLMVQREKSEDFLDATTVVTESTLLSDGVVEAMVRDVDEDFALNFNVKLRGSVRVYAQSFLRIHGRHSLSINCDDVKVEFFPYDGTPTGLMMMDATPTKGCYYTKLIF